MNFAKSYGEGTSRLEGGVDCESGAELHKCLICQTGGAPVTGVSSQNYVSSRIPTVRCGLEFCRPIDWNSICLT